MPDQQWLAERFEENRSHLHSVAQRMLGSAAEADDAVQEAWFRLSRSDSGSIQDFRAWLTTVVSRVCLDLLRSRTTRREDSLEAEAPFEAVASSHPESELMLADSVGVALQIVLDRLAPSERVAVVLHDFFGMDFDEIGAILGKTAAATRQLASRARRRIQGVAPGSHDGRRRREIVEEFLAALRSADFQRLVAVLDPDLVFHADRFSATAGREVEIRGAEKWAKGAIAFAAAAREVDLALVDGEIGIVLARDGKLARVLRITFAGDKIKNVDVVGDPERLSEFNLSLLG